MKPARLAILAIAVAAGLSASWAWRVFHDAPTHEARKVLVFQCPMHPWVKSDQPSTCTVCGMNLVLIDAGGEAIESGAGSQIILNDGIAQVAGVKTEYVRKMSLTRTLRVSGIIGEDESRHGIISAPVEGRIDGLAMTGDGDKVTRRQPLATIFSRTLLGAANDYQLALPQGGPALDQARRRLEQYGLVWEQIKAIPLRQPDDIYFGILGQLTGTIVKSYVSEGQYVREGDRLFEIADFTKMWFNFTADERDLPLIRVGQAVTVHLPSLPGESLISKVGFISPNLDPATRSVRVRVVLENPERRIKNNTYADAVVELDAPEVIAIPRSAVIWPGKQPRVYVENSVGNYQPREVKLGRVGDTVWEVIDGLTEGERVVTQGGLLMDGQAQLMAMAGSNDHVAHPVTGADLPSALADYIDAAAAVSFALAADDLPAANAALEKLPTAPAGLVNLAAPAPSQDLLKVRKSFLPWCDSLATLVIQAKPKIAGMRVFRCTMTQGLWAGAPASGMWIQRGPDPKNPYWGSAMQNCGEEMKP